MTHISVLFILTAFKFVLSHGSCGIKTSIKCKIRSGPKQDRQCEGNIMNDDSSCRKVPVTFTFEVCIVNPSLRKVRFDRNGTQLKLRGKVVDNFNKSRLVKSVKCRSKIKNATINTCEQKANASFRVKRKTSRKTSCTSYSFFTITPISTCPCFNTERMGKAVKGILNDSKYLNKEFSCKKSDNDSMSLLYGNPYHWIRDQYSVRIDQCGDSDMRFNINPNQATECLRLLEGGCESIRNVLDSPDTEKCPCFNVHNLVEAVKKIRLITLPPESDICSISDDITTINLPAIETQGIEQTKRYAAHIEEQSGTCMTGDEVTKITSDEASYCLSLMEDACNELKY
eukprot:CAMPEP_0198257626 /NCGR_PEP_ID=MMETSP1447-20131203/7245_1 /TAXON_ID=420782 /ORGANISM="Chaetoceros dichaeta, Strain CCMP1751" /LENGTH=341 /DNA_ID=CAMNT_0043944569 /DNA_START=92 /DNA_END=1117 /DNA_ORIENTATION=+